MQFNDKDHQKAKAFEKAKEIILNDKSTPWMGGASFLNSINFIERPDALDFIILAGAYRTLSFILKTWNPSDPDLKYLYEDPLFDSLSALPLWMPEELTNKWVSGEYKKSLPSEDSDSKYLEILNSKSFFNAFNTNTENYFVNDIWYSFFASAQYTQWTIECLDFSADKLDQLSKNSDICIPIEECNVFKNVSWVGNNLKLTQEQIYFYCIFVSLIKSDLFKYQRNINNLFSIPVELVKSINTSYQTAQHEKLLELICIGFRMRKDIFKDIFNNDSPLVKAGFLNNIFINYNNAVNYRHEFSNILAVMHPFDAKIFNNSYNNANDLLSKFVTKLSPHDREINLDSFNHIGDGILHAKKALTNNACKILIWGPPGSGKTQLALLLASEAGKIPVTTGDIKDFALQHSQNKPGVARVMALKRVESFARAVGEPIIITDECENILILEEAKSLITSALDDISVPQIWIANDLEGVHQAYLRRFDFILHIQDMPLITREKLAETLFKDKQLSARVAQALHTPAQIKSVYDWCKACNKFEWNFITMKIAGDQKAILTAQAPENGEFKIEIAPPDINKEKGLSSIVGFDDLILQAKKIANIFEKPASYQELGAKVPKGILLSGPPGSGKTLFARALANEVGVPVAMAKTSELASNPERIGLLFNEARKRAPCIVFLDEIDALATNPETQDGIDSSKQQILNRLLVEIDGFDPLDGVMILAATHKPDRIDPALIRSGRIGKKIHFRYPNIESRKQIWQYYLNKVKADKISSIQLTSLARASGGFSAADIAEATNIAAINAAENNQENVLYEQFLKACDDIFWGEDPIESEEFKNLHERTAYHEAGHALVAFSFGKTIERATIKPRTAFLGAVHNTLEDDLHVSFTKEELFNECCILMAGLAAEEIQFKSRTDGACSDLYKATSMTRKAFTSFSFAVNVFKNSVQLPFAEISQQKLIKLENEEDEFLNSSFNKTKKWLLNHHDTLNKFAQYLLSQREVSRDEISNWIQDNVKNLTKINFDN